MEAEPEVSDTGRRHALALVAVAALAIGLPLFPILVATTGSPALGRLAPIPGLVLAAIGFVKVVAAGAGLLAELRRRPWMAAVSLE
jgi:hypothetical protein